MTADQAKKTATAHLEGYRFGSRARPKPGTHRYFGEAYLIDRLSGIQKESDSIDEMENWLYENRGYNLIWGGFFDAQTGSLMREGTGGKVSAPTHPTPAPKPATPPPSSSASPPADGLPASIPPEDKAADLTASSGPSIKTVALVGVGVAAVVLVLSSAMRG